MGCYVYNIRIETQFGEMLEFGSALLRVKHYNIDVSYSELP